jgi:hypothetical protein
MPRISQITPWLERRAALGGFLKINERQPHNEFGGFLAIDVAQSIHTSVDLPGESLESSWKAIHDYVESALSLIKARSAVDLDKYESELIRKELGEPPTLCYPIYLITVAKDGQERLVYIGKSSTKNGRFKGGHAAITRLHDPKFDGHTKTIYLAAVVLLSDRHQCQPLEWIDPLENALAILASIEAQLIYEFKPELNTYLVDRNNAQWPVTIHIQNSSGYSQFLNDYFCYPQP